MSEQTREERIANIRRLTNDTRHIRKVALNLAGAHLQYAVEEIIEDEMGSLDEEDAQDDEYYDALCKMMDQVHQEIARIGEELSRQSKEDE